MPQRTKRERLWGQIMGAIVESYGSTDCPNYRSLWKKYDGLLYARPICELLRTFCLEETTDMNCDLAVNLTMVLPQAEGTRWFVQLSLVGPFATVMRYQESDEGGRPLLIWAERADLSQIEQKLLRILQRHRIHVLDEDMLTTKIDFCHVNEEPGLVPLYRVLFYMEDEPLPWEG